MFDSHAHVVASQFEADRADVVARAKAAGLVGWIEVGTNLQESRLAVELAQREEGIYATVGVHPHDVAELSASAWAELEELADKPNVAAIGEVGFDFYRGGRREMQQPVLEKFIMLARAKNLPMVFHVRDGKEDNAHDALLHLLESFSEHERPRGVIHTYSGTVAQAERYLALGMYLSFSGVVTFKKAGELLAVVKMVPADMFLVETDCPFLAPEPYRGQRNEPSYVRVVAQKVAAVRGVSVDEVEEQTDGNVKRLFSL